MPFERRNVIKQIGEEFQRYYESLLNIFEDSNSTYKCSPRSLLSAVPEAFCRQIISGMFLENVRKQSTKTHACVFNTRVRFRYFVV